MIRKPSDLRIRFNLKFSNVIIFILIGVVVLYTFYSSLRIPKDNSIEINESDGLERLEDSKVEDSRLNDYSKWPDYFKFTSEYLEYLKKQNNLMNDFCIRKYFENKNQTSIEDLESILNIWQRNKNADCRYLYKMFRKIYEIKFKSGKLSMSDKLSDKVKSWLNNDLNLLNQAYAQV